MSAIGVFNDNDAKSKPARELAALSRRYVELRAERGEVTGRVETARREHADALAELEKTEADQRAFGGQAKAVKAAQSRVRAAERGELEATSEAGLLGRAIEAVEARAQAVATEHADELRAERAGHAKRAAEGLAALLRELPLAVSAWNAEWAQCGRFERSVNPDALRIARLPDLPDEVARFAKIAPQLADRVQSPVLHTAPPAAPLVAPEDDPDPDVRERARSEARIRAAAGRVDGGAAA